MSNRPFRKRQARRSLGYSPLEPRQLLAADCGTQPQTDFDTSTGTLTITGTDSNDIIGIRFNVRLDGTGVGRAETILSTPSSGSVRQEFLSSMGIERIVIFGEGGSDQISISGFWIDDPLEIEIFGGDGDDRISTQLRGRNPNSGGVGSNLTSSISTASLLVDGEGGDDRITYDDNDDTPFLGPLTFAGGDGDDTLIRPTLWRSGGRHIGWWTR